MVLYQKEFVSKRAILSLFWGNSSCYSFIQGDSGGPALYNVDGTMIQIGIASLGVAGYLWL